MLNLFRKAVCILLLIVAATAHADDDRLHTVKKAFAEEFHMEGAFNALVASGLSADDAEKISDKVAMGLASCFIDALIEISEVDSVPVEDVLDKIEAIVASGDGQRLDSEIDIPAIEVEAQSCVYDVATEAGIDLPVSTD